MKKYTALFLTVICLISLFVGCSKNDGDKETESTADFSMNTWDDDFAPDFPDDEIQGDDEIPSDENSTIPQGNNNSGGISIPTTSPNGGSTPTTRPSGGSSETTTNALGMTDDDLSKLNQSNAEVYFSDNPNNKYIVKIVNKYGSDPKNLIALIKVNAQFPSGMVLEFSGKRDADGELIMTYQELKYVYNIDDTTNKITRAGKTGGNDGVSSMESRITFMLMKEYFIPQLPELKANKNYD